MLVVNGPINYWDKYIIIIIIIHQLSTNEFQALLEEAGHGSSAVSLDLRTFTGLLSFGQICWLGRDRFGSY